MSRSTAFYGLLITTAAAFVIGLAALILASINASNGNGSMTLFLSTPPSLLLSLYATGPQRLSNGGGAWHHVTFDQEIQVASDTSIWLHEPETDTIVCGRTGNYSVYFSVQAQLNNSNAMVIPWECQACNLRYAIRGQVSRDTVNFFEIEGSYAYSSGQNFFLAKQFFINAFVGDLFTFDIISPCANLILFPDAYLNMPNSSIVIDSLYPSSATLLISM